MADSDIVPFKVNIPQSEVDRLKRKLQDTRLPPKEIVPGAGNKYGIMIFCIHADLDLFNHISQAPPMNGLRSYTKPG